MTPLIVGHRGVAGTHPENTMASIQQAIALGLDWIEVDVQPTKDGELVICHDHTIDRCSNGKGRVDSYTLADLKALDFGSWFDTQFSGELILTLDDLLHIAEQHNLGLNLEVKVDQHDSQAVVKQLKKQLEQSPIPKNKLLLSSFSHDVMRELHQHCGAYRLAVISERLNDSVRLLLSEINAFSCNLNYFWLAESHIKELRDNGYQVWCFTVNTPESFPLLENVDAIFSDFPSRFDK